MSVVDPGPGTLGSDGERDARAPRRDSHFCNEPPLAELSICLHEARRRALESGARMCDRDDVAQETLARVWRRLRNGSGAGSVTFQNPGFWQGKLAIQALVFDASMFPVGTSSAALN